jgi:CotH kinase protein/RTX calcium-binding nonapeptide repeat (4 copies)
VSERGKASSRPTSSGLRAARWRSLWRCFLSALFLGLVSPAWAPAAVTGEPPADDPAAWLFSPAAVVEIDLTLPQQSIDALSSDPTEYQDGTFSLTTTSEKYGPLNVGLRLKGAASFRPLGGKAAFKVKLDHSVPGQRFFGLKTLTLNNMVQDPSMIHEVLAYEVFRSAGVAASRTGYAYVRVNDQDYGVYLNIETLDDVMLSRWLESTQHLYEGESDPDAVPPGVDVLPGNAARFSVDEGSETDLSDLEALIAAVDGDGDFSNRVKSVADIRQLTRMWAVEKYIGHWDGYSGVIGENHPSNYYLHSDSADRFRMLPWGTDQTFAEHLAFGGKASVMFNECLHDPSCFSLYRNAVRDVRSLIGGLDLDSRAASTAALLAPWQAKDPRREYSLEDIQTAVAATRDFIATRPCDVAAWLGDPHTTPPDTGIGGTDGSDVLSGTSARDVIVGLGGNDKLSGHDGNDVICGGKGKDTLKGGPGKDKLYGQKGKDTLKGGPGKDTLKGG